MEWNTGMKYWHGWNLWTLGVKIIDREYRVPIARKAKDMIPYRWNFWGMKFSQISRIIPASWIYNYEHFMHHQLIVYAQQYCHCFALPLWTHRFCFLFSYASQGFSWCCIPQIIIHVISTNATIENKCNFIHNGTY